MLIDEAPTEGPEENPQGEDQVEGYVDDTMWLSMAKEADRTSTDYLDQNYRKQFEKNISNFRIKHPDGSKYYTEAYKSRSRFYRPKIRTAIRNSEANYSESLFGSREVFTVEPVNQADKDGKKVAMLWQGVLNYRLRHNIPWFLTAIGAFQETKNYGVVISKQYWNVSTPWTELVPIENIRFDPGASWIDPVNTSPYWIELIPMYVDDVVLMTQREGNPYRWRQYDRETIITAGKTTEVNDETLRRKREGNKQDPKEPDAENRYFKIVWVYRIFIKHEGQDYEFYTIGTQKMLCDPVPVTPETHPLGRNYRVGISTIEAHRVIPAADAELAQDLQAEANDIANQRMDNVKLVLNKGYFVHRDAGADIATLRRSYPGRIVFYKGQKDMIQPDVTQDVTSSAYAEQDRINHDIDDLMGGFSGGSVASNRALNETVGGMRMFQQSGNKIQAYSARTFVETWVEPVLTDLVVLEQAYEDEQTIQLFMSKLPQKQPQQQQQDTQQAVQPLSMGQMQGLKMSVCVTAGLGSLDPDQRAAAFMQTLIAMSKVAPWQMAKLDTEQVSNELFGVIGYRDGSRFFTEFVNMPEKQGNPEVEIKAQELKIKQDDMVMRQQVIMAELQLKREIEMAKLALNEQITLKQLYAKLDLEMDKHNLNILKELGAQEKIQKDREEMQLKMRMGSGI